MDFLFKLWHKIMPSMEPRFLDPTNPNYQKLRQQHITDQIWMKRLGYIGIAGVLFLLAVVIVLAYIGITEY